MARSAAGDPAYRRTRTQTATMALSPLTVDSTAPVEQERGSAQVGEGADGEGEERKEGDGRTGDVTVHGHQVLGPTLARRPQKPTAVPAVDGPGEGQMG